jgi:hypothetical protein
LSISLKMATRVETEAGLKRRWTRTKRVFTLRVRWKVLRGPCSSKKVWS